MGREPEETFVQLVGAGGEKLPVVGKSRVWLNLGNQSFELSVIIIQQFKFDLLLRDEFLRKEMIVLDYGNKVVKIGGDKVTFEPLPSACVAFLRSVVELIVGSPVRVQAGFLGNYCELALFGERQLVKTDERVLVAPVITKYDGNNSVWLKLVNTTRSPVILQLGTKVQHLQPITVGVNTVNDIQSEEVREATEVSVDELKNWSPVRRTADSLVKCLEETSCLA